MVGGSGTAVARLGSPSTAPPPAAAARCTGSTLGPNQEPRGLAGRYSTGYSHQNVLLRFGINVVRHIEITG
jgi:hypothetical protein